MERPSAGDVMETANAGGDRSVAGHRHETVRRMHEMPYGAAVLPDGSVRFAFWAPLQQSVRLVLVDRDDVLPMERLEEGWHRLVTDRVGAGSRYLFELEDGTRVPDPASRRQPEDVHGPSEVVDPHAHDWSDGGWLGRPWHEAVVYELHVGTFTAEGTFRAAIERLDHLVELGVTAVELMPVADFPGRWNWGYDGTYLYAPDASYGRPEDLKALVDAAHARGLMVLLDVVYNHYGPEGNYFGSYAPLFTERHKTPWGAAINYDGVFSRPIRDFVIHNVLYWLDEYHLDGLRLDAVHAIVDDSDQHLLSAIAERVQAVVGSERHVHLVLENDGNEARWLERAAEGRARWYAAQWADDLHHGLHVAATGEDGGYYLDYHGQIERLGRALAEGFAFQGEASAFKHGERRGEPSAHLPPTAFVAFLQNHDQIGNRALGERITSLAPPETVRAVAALYLLAPSIPMLFMGEEWGTERPFPYFCDFGPELTEAVRRGRAEEFGRFPEFADPARRDRIPDPASEATFESAKLDWSDLDRTDHSAWLDWYRQVIAVRQRHIMPLLPRIAGGAGAYEVIGASALRVTWRVVGGGGLSVLANLSAEPLSEVAVPDTAPLWREGPEGRALGPWTVVWSLTGS